MNTEDTQIMNNVLPTPGGKHPGRPVKMPDLFASAIKLNVLTLFNRILVMLQVNDLRRARDHLETVWQLVEQLRDDRIHAEYCYWYGMVEIASNNSKEGCLAFIHAMMFIDHQSHATHTWVHYLHSHWETTAELISEHTANEDEARRMTAGLRHFLERYKYLEDHGPLPNQASVLDEEISTLMSTWGIGTRLSRVHQQPDTIEDSPVIVESSTAETQVQPNGLYSIVTETGQSHDEKSDGAKGQVEQPTDYQDDGSVDVSSDPEGTSASRISSISSSPHVSTQLRRHSFSGSVPTTGGLTSSAFSPQPGDAAHMATDAINPDTASVSPSPGRNTLFSTRDSGDEERDELYEQLLRQISRNSLTASESFRKAFPNPQDLLRSENPILPADAVDDFNTKQLIMTGRRRIDRYLNIGSYDLDRSRKQSLDDIDLFNQSQLNTESRRKRKQSETPVSIKKGLAGEDLMHTSPIPSPGISKVLSTDDTCDNKSVDQQHATPVDEVRKDPAGSAISQDDATLSDTLMPREIADRLRATSSRIGPSGAMRRRGSSASIAVVTDTKRVVYQQTSRRGSLEPRSPTSPLALSVSTEEED